MKVGVAMVEALAAGFAGLFLVFAVVFLVAMRRVLLTRRPIEALPPAGLSLKLVARIVLSEKGDMVGETVSAEGEHIILKQGGQFFAVPRTALREDGEKLRAESVDWEEALRKGEQWRARQENAISDDLGKAG